MSTALTRLKIAVFAPMPSASVAIAIVANPGARASRRKAYRTSDSKLSMSHLRLRTLEAVKNRRQSLRSRPLASARQSKLKLAGRLLSDPWRPGKICQRQEGGINFLHEWAILFGLGFHGLPFRIVLEGFPVRGCRFAARVLQNVKERAASHGLVQRRPVGNTFDSMFRKELIRMISEAGHEAVELSWDRVIDAQFIDLR